MTLDVPAGDLSPDPALALELARHAHRLGERDRALGLLVRAMRSGGWRRGVLWAELVEMTESAEDLVRIRDLWLESPVECHRIISILRAVARVAFLVGDHTGGRALLRKAILQHARQQPASRVGRGPRRKTRGSAAPTVIEPHRFAAEDGAAMRDLHQVLHGAGGLRSFLVAGTVLGLVREGDLTVWGKDLDVGLFRDEADIEVVRDAFDRDARFSVRQLDLSTDRLRLRHQNTAQIDVFPHYEEDGRVWHDGTATRWWNTPFELKEAEFLGTSQLIPADTERYLTESYGDWRTPDPLFEARLDAPNVEITDQDSFDSLHYVGLLDALTNTTRAESERYLALVQSLEGEAPWLERLPR